ncbi:MAG: ferrous iron transport protein A [Atopobiaceae bacterium]|nr:ferrous iron transport protein A [Atopobiaceae bacterium]
MPLTLLKPGESSIITRLGGNPQTRKFLEGLGFVVGAPVTVISSTDGNVICSIKDTRVAISKQMAAKIYV